MTNSSTFTVYRNTDAKRSYFVALDVWTSRNLNLFFQGGVYVNHGGGRDLFKGIYFYQVSESRIMVELSVIIHVVISHSFSLNLL